MYTTYLSVGGSGGGDVDGSRPLITISIGFIQFIAHKGTYYDLQILVACLGSPDLHRYQKETLQDEGVS